jgi:hypothetical protein
VVRRDKEESSVKMDEMLRRAICDYFEAGDFAEYIGVTVDDLINAFPDEVDDVLDDIKEIMGYENLDDED